MKITSRGRYAVLAMVDIAKHGESSPCSLAHISIRQNISLSYLEQIFNDLKIDSISSEDRFMFCGSMGLNNDLKAIMVKYNDEYYFPHFNSIFSNKNIEAKDLGQFEIKGKKKNINAKN